MGTCKVHGDLPGEVRKRILAFQRNGVLSRVNPIADQAQGVAIQVLNVLIPI